MFGPGLPPVPLIVVPFESALPVAPPPVELEALPPAAPLLEVCASAIELVSVTAVMKSTEVNFIGGSSMRCHQKSLRCAIVPLVRNDKMETKCGGEVKLPRSAGRSRKKIASDLFHLELPVPAVRLSQAPRATEFGCKMVAGCFRNCSPL